MQSSGNDVSFTFWDTNHTMYRCFLHTESQMNYSGDFELYDPKQSADLFRLLNGFRGKVKMTISNKSLGPVEAGYKTLSMKISTDIPSNQYSASIILPMQAQTSFPNQDVKLEGGSGCRLSIA